MAKQGKSSSKGQEAALPLIDLIELTQPAPPGPGAYDISAELRATISQALKDCPDSRHMVAARMSELTGAEITKSMLDAWTAESKEQHRFPAEYLPAFCLATNNHKIVDVIVRPLGGRFFQGRAALDAEAGQLSARIKDMQEQLKNLNKARTKIFGEEAK